MTHHQFTRRQILSTTSLAAVGMVGTSAQAAYDSNADGFAYEVTRSETEWRTRLTATEFKILREGATEQPKSSPLWQETADGAYFCKGCDLNLYTSDWKVIVDKGWVFFKHGVANSLLTGVDWPEGASMTKEFAPLAAIEVHCRRCGSHMGHVVYVEDQILHCINGASLNFTRKMT